MLHFLPFSMSTSVFRTSVIIESLPHTMNPVQDGVLLVVSYSLRLSYPLSTHSLRDKCEAQWGVVGPSHPPSSWRNGNLASPQGRLEEKPEAWGLSFHPLSASSPLTSQCLGQKSILWIQMVKHRERQRISSLLKEDDPLDAHVGPNAICLHPFEQILSLTKLKVDEAYLTQQTRSFFATLSLRMRQTCFWLRI